MEQPDFFKNGRTAGAGLHNLIDDSQYLEHIGKLRVQLMGRMTKTNDPALKASLSTTTIQQP
ncbi:hypothetical protein [Rubritalea profundi]|uniref:Uncharacterized protein n=1 Tax=Rubritalea profundi TaxID=1658618 RepID=A0A2S7TZL7_9BACT|nr:hypothetical protein [Rubritalea profundi]PQJ28188.1 hypothetical protein BSZ32_06500 [Rubritalea profundi]